MQKGRWDIGCQTRVKDTKEKSAGQKSTKENTVS